MEGCLDYGPGPDTDAPWKIADQAVKESSAESIKSELRYLYNERANINKKIEELQEKLRSSKDR